MEKDSRRAVQDLVTYFSTRALVHLSHVYGD